MSIRCNGALLFLVHVKYTGDDASEVCLALWAASGFAAAAVQNCGDSLSAAC
jgi:hypothetical protein